MDVLWSIQRPDEWNSQYVQQRHQPNGQQKSQVWALSFRFVIHFSGYSSITQQSQPW
jgi:hypothetical protein